ncbi:MAG: hypothetical protein HC866_17595 [Leptolyngbyaceae cyanobacterium RU_5_1]|nr:hypothetical protein [Leptolyngbyaceae cyanobacterium RU_5_1]
MNNWRLNRWKHWLVAQTLLGTCMGALGYPEIALSQSKNRQPLQNRRRRLTLER